MWVVDLGCDAIHHYTLDRETRALERKADIMVGAGRGPRHMTMLPERGLAMVVCELENYIMVRPEHSDHSCNLHDAKTD